MSLRSAWATYEVLSLREIGREEEEKEGERERGMEMFVAQTNN